jgi:reactive intermediate/imine deaminase
MIKKLTMTALVTAALTSSALLHATEVEYLNSESELTSTMPFSEAVRVDDVVYLSGQIGIVPGTMELASGGMKEEATQIMENIKTSLEAHDLTMDNVVKCLVMLTDMSEWSDMNEVYRSYFTEGRYPARSAFGVSALALDARAEVECIAVVDND